jgi:hypothetical protein
MPKLVGSDDDMQTYQIAGSNFTFQATRIAGLGAPDYTLVTIMVDTTGSTEGFSDQLHKMLVTAIKACMKSPRREYLLVRVVLFSTSYPDGLLELHGFKKVLDIDPDKDYKKFGAFGATPLWDAVYTGVSATVEYGGDLMAREYNCNAIFFAITDGKEGDWTGEPVSTATMQMIADAMKAARNKEKLESLISILVRINAAMYQAELDEFYSKAGFTHSIDAGKATEESLAALAAFISQSVSSQSQAIGTGGPSKQISASI